MTDGAKDDSGTPRGEYIEIIEDDSRARTHFKRALDAERPQEPTVEVPADLLAELAAYAGRGNWVISSTVLSETEQYLKTEGDDAE